MLARSPAEAVTLAPSFALSLACSRAGFLTLAFSVAFSLMCSLLRCLALSLSRSVAFLSFLLTRSRAEAVTLDRSSALSPACSLAFSRSGRLDQFFVCKLARVFVFSLVRSPLSIAVVLSLVLSLTSAASQNLKCSARTVPQNHCASEAHGLFFCEVEPHEILPVLLLLNAYEFCLLSGLINQSPRHTHIDSIINSLSSFQTS